MRNKMRNKPNYELMLKRAIGSLQNVYEEYKKAVHASIKYTFINDNGEFCVLGGQEERQVKVENLNQQLLRLKNQIEEIRGHIYDDQSKNGTAKG